MNRVDEAADEIFARHETFHPRYGWFRKAVAAAAKSPDMFTREDAPVELGVGKNMVRAIRFWGKAAKLLVDVDDPDRPRLAATVPTKNGETLLGEHVGLDPYLELPGSLWLLHWWMLAKPCSLPVWWIAFNQFGSVEFSEEDLLQAVLDDLRRIPSWALPVEASIKKDVDCLIRMYAPRTAGRFALDDLLDCPFRELGLVDNVLDDAHRYRFVIGAKPALPPEIVAYACLEYLATADPSARTITVNRLVFAPSGPGRVFKLTEEALTTALEQYATSNDGIRLTSAAGVIQLAVKGDPRQQAVDALRTYYQRAGHRVEEPIELGAEAATRGARLVSRENC